jgi:hypothetical protein
MVETMKYSSGQEVRLGDKVKLGDDIDGVVVCSIDTDEYSYEFPRAQWEYLARGVLVKFAKYGVIHYEQAEPELELLARVA